MAGLPARLDGLGAGLDDEQLTVFAVLGPFHIHRLTVVVFDVGGPARQLQHLVDAQDEVRSLLLACVDYLRSAAAAGVDHLDRLAAERLFDDRRQAGLGQ